MSPSARSALVFQGGGALGAYELGAARRLYRNEGFAPDVVAGVSIGAITAALLGRPARGSTPLQALESFWNEVAVQGWFLPPPLQRYASLFGNAKFFWPRVDYFALPSWTYLYDTEPLRHTLESLVDLAALADPQAVPRLLVSATDIEAGQIEYFRSDEGGLQLDHVMASCSLPPSFAMTVLDGHAYWDGGLFDNTPLGAVLDTLDDGPGVERTVYVVSLFPNKAPIPGTMAEVGERLLDLQFANKTAQDLKLMRRFNEVADLMAALDALPADSPIRQEAAFKALQGRHYIRVPRIVSITRPEAVGVFDGGDFSPEAIERRAAEGYAQTDRALRDAGLAS